MKKSLKSQHQISFAWIQHMPIAFVLCNIQHPLKSASLVTPPPPQPIKTPQDAHAHPADQSKSKLTRQRV